jgi:ureidoglycolate lyase
LGFAAWPHFNMTPTTPLVTSPSLPIHPLTMDAFAPYGEVLCWAGGAGQAINSGTSQRVDLLAGLALWSEQGRPALAVFRAQARAVEGPWQTLERHRLGSQTFVPLTGARCVALVALGGDTPDASTLAAFLVTGQQGITLRPGVWHHPLIALDAGDFLVIERTAAAVDCEECVLPHAVALRWDAHTGIS